MRRLAFALALLLAATPAFAPPAAEDTSSDYGVVHTFPKGRAACTLDTICSVRI